MAYHGGFLPGGPGGDTLDERRRQLLEFLAGRGATSAGFQGLHGRVQSAVGQQGGRGGIGPLPNLTYNPFFSQIAGRNENFAGGIPNGVTPAAMAAVQAGTQVPGGVTAGPGAAPVQQPAGGFQGGRNLIGAQGAPPPGTVGGDLAAQSQAQQGQVAQQLSPYQQLTPIDPYAALRRIGGSGIGRF